MHGIEFQVTSHDVLLGFSDADWAGDMISRRSTSDYAFIMSGGCVSWKSKKQRAVALSSTEAEYMTLSEATQEAVWLKAFCASSARCLWIQRSRPTKIIKAQLH